MKKTILLAIAMVFAVVANAQKEATMVDLLSHPLMTKCNVYSSSIKDVQKELSKSKDITMLLKFQYDKSGDSEAVYNYGIQGSAYCGVRITGFNLREDSDGKRSVNLMFKVGGADKMQELAENMVADLQALGFTIRKQAVPSNDISFDEHEGYNFIVIYKTESLVKLTYNYPKGITPSFL